MAFRAMIIFLASLVLAGATTRDNAEVTPVEKVIQLINGMIAKGKEDKQGEVTQFAAYKQWCDDTSTEKKRSIAEAEELMEKLSADIAEYTSNAKVLGQEMAEGVVEEQLGDKAQASLVQLAKMPKMNEKTR